MVITFILLLILGAFAGDSRADGPERWDTTETIGGTEIPAMWPMVAGDQWGRVHVIWTQPLDSVDSGVYAIVHRMKDADGWHEANDIILRDSWAYSNPYLLIARDWAYMLWSQWDGLYFSRASAWNLGSAQAWERAEKLTADTGVEQSRMALDSAGTLHVVYGRGSTSLAGDGGVYYTSSADGGVTWNTPTKISLQVDPDNAADMRPRLAIDPQNNIHVTWSEYAAPDWRGEKVYYAHHLAGEEDWSAPVVLSQPRPDGVSLWYQAAPSLVSDHDGIIHLVWVCGEHTHRCYKQSRDLGTTWSETEQILGNYESLAGWDDMTVDEANNVHLVAQLRSPYNVYHVTKPSGQSWGEPVPVSDVKEVGVIAHYPRIAITRGNELHIVTQPDKAGPIWYISGRNSSGSIDVVSTPVRSRVKGAVTPQASTPIVDPTQTPTPGLGTDQGQSVVSEQSASSGRNIFGEVPPVLLGVFPALLLVAGAIIWRVNEQHR